MSQITMPITMTDEEGVETVVNLPAKYEICTHCRGTGKSSSYLGAFTHDEFEQQGEEFMEDYLAGRYDRDCEHCEGSGKVLLIDEPRCTTPEFKAALIWVRDMQQSIDEERAIVAAEMRLMGDY